MKVSFYANLRTVVGAKTVEVGLDAGSRVGPLLAGLVQRYPALKPHLFDEAGNLRPHVHVFVNGHDVNVLPAKLDTHLTPGDQVDIFPPVGGG